MNSADGTVTLTGNVADLTVSGEQPTGGTWEISNAKDVADGGRGIKVTDVTFASMNGYKCSNNLTTGKVTCAK